MRMEGSQSHQMDVEHNGSFPALSGPTLFVKQTKRFEREAKRAAFSLHVEDLVLCSELISVFHCGCVSSAS